MESKPRVLIVEDNKINLFVTTELLKKSGYQVDSCTDGKEAVELLSSQSFDIILMDLQMPNMDGFEATHVIRAADSAVIDHNVPIIAVTAYATENTRRECFESGMDDFLEKPITAGTLFEKIEALTGPKTQSDENHQETTGDQETANQQGATEGSDFFDEKEFLTRVMDDKNFASELALQFRDQIPQLMEMIRQALATGSLRMVGETAHKLSGIAANLSFGTLYNQLKRIQESSLAGEHDTLGTMVDEAEALYIHAVDVLKKRGYLPI
ncbi:MAG: response regulator [Spirochaetales bacterium]|nr:response regulator [Spirochaetales bacterium]MCF7939729.1 response regulator [Spirochaetales bacterium]